MTEHNYESDTLYYAFHGASNLLSDTVRQILSFHNDVPEIINRAKSALSGMPCNNYVLEFRIWKRIWLFKEIMNWHFTGAFDEVFINKLFKRDYDWHDYSPYGNGVYTKCLPLPK